MMNIKGIFAVSLIAMVAMVAGAHTSNAVAAIASQGYVDQQVGSKLSSISGSTTGSGNVVTVVSASGSTVSVTKGITAEETKNKVTSTNYDANVSSDTKYPTVKAVADAIADVEKKIPAAITVDSALSSTSTNPVQNKVINSALAGKEVTSNKVTSANYAANVSNDTKYPTVKAVADALAGKADATDLDGKVDVFQGGTKANQAVITNGSGNIITGFITKSMLGEDVVIPDEYELPPATESALGGVKSGGDINVSTAGVVTVANGVIDASALGTNSVATVKIQDGAVTTAKIYDGAVTADKIAPGVIPTVPTVNNATLTIKKNGESVGTFTANASADKEIDIDVPEAEDILTTTTVTSSGTGAVLTGVSVTPGKVTLQKGNVQIPSGGQNATSYVSIWVE